MWVEWVSITAEYQQELYDEIESLKKENAFLKKVLSRIAKLFMEAGDELLDSTP